MRRMSLRMKIEAVVLTILIIGTTGYIGLTILEDNFDTDGTGDYMSTFNFDDVDIQHYGETADLTILEDNFDTDGTGDYMSTFNFDDVDIQHYGETAGFIVFKENGTYYAKNGMTGTVEKTSENASETIQYAIDRLNNGGTVYLMHGIYYIDSTINIYGGICLKGGNRGAAGEGTYLILKDHANCDIIHFALRDGESFNYFGRIADMTLVGHSQNQDSTSRGIVCTVKHHYTVVERIHTQGMRDEGYYVTEGYGHVIRNSWLHDPIYIGNDESGTYRMRIFQNSLSEVESNYAILINHSHGVEIADNQIFNNYGRGLVIDHSYGVVVTGNHIWYNSKNSVNTYDNIYLDNAHHLTFTGNKVGNIYNNDNSRYSIYIDETCYSIISDNVLNTGKTGIIGINPIGWANPYNDLIIRDNPRYNPVGVISNPFRDADPSIGINGVNSVPTESMDYEVKGLDLIITSIGGNGVNITIKDKSGTAISTGLPTVTNLYLPIEYKISFGDFSVAPNLIVSGN